MFRVFLHSFRSVLASNSVNWSSDGRELFRYFLEFTHAKRPFFSAAAWREIALRPHGLLTHSPFGLEEQLLISKIQLAGQKYRDNTTQARLERGCVTAVQFILFTFAKYSPSIGMELKVSKEITRKWQNQRFEANQGGQETAFDLAAFRLSMIAPVKKSVNHSRTVASMREKGWEVLVIAFFFRLFPQ